MTPLSEAIALYNSGSKDASLDAVYDHVDGLLERGDFESARLALVEGAESADAAVTVLLSLLTITLGHCERFATERAAVADAIARQLEARSETERLAGLLQGLQINPKPGTEAQYAPCVAAFFSHCSNRLGP